MMLHNTTVIIIRKGDKILLIKRKNKTWHDYWAVPGGHVDKGENVWQAAQREANEEVGDVKVDKKPFLVFEHSVPEGERRFPEKHVHKCYCFYGKVFGEIKAGSDAGIFGWFTKQELKGLRITNYTKKALGL